MAGARLVVLEQTVIAGDAVPEGQPGRKLGCDANTVGELSGGLLTQRVQLAAVGEQLGDVVDRQPVAAPPRDGDGDREQHGNDDEDLEDQHDGARDGPLDLAERHPGDGLDGITGGTDGADPDRDVHAQREGDRDGQRDEGQGEGGIADRARLTR